jgi:hypothetical protein
MFGPAIGNWFGVSVTEGTNPDWRDADHRLGEFPSGVHACGVASRTIRGPSCARSPGGVEAAISPRGLVAVEHPPGSTLLW